jgi:hypothetical protein
MFQVLVIRARENHLSGQHAELLINFRLSFARLLGPGSGVQVLEGTAAAWQWRAVRARPCLLSRKSTLGIGAAN